MLKENFIALVQESYKLDRRNERVAEYSNSKSNKKLFTKIRKFWWKIEEYVLDTITVLSFIGVLYMLYIALYLCN